MTRLFLPLSAGVLLAASGWYGAGGLQDRTPVFQPQLMVRPAGAEVVTRRGKPPDADPLIAGRFVFDQGDLALELRQPNWAPASIEIDQPRGMTTLRAPWPRATLSVSVKGDAEASVSLLELPKKTRLKTAQGQARLEPGRHELLVQADGYLPRRLSVNLKPGERKELAIEMEALVFPGLAFPSLPPAGVRPYPGTSLPYPPTYRPPPSPPPYQAPPVYDPPAPVPRFTPIPAPPEPTNVDPVPMFTPIGN
jgi:hypothetical protein